MKHLHLLTVEELRVQRNTPDFMLEHFITFCFNTLADSFMEVDHRIKASQQHHAKIKTLQFTMVMFYSSSQLENPINYCGNYIVPIAS